MQRLPRGLPIPNKRKIIVDFDDDNEPLEVEYSPRLSFEGFQQVKSLDEEGDTETATIRWLAKSITRWDFEDEGKPVPITVESLEQLLEDEILTLANAIKADFEQHVMPALERAIERQQGRRRHP